HKESFTIPPNYFETLSSHIMDKVAQQATTPESDLTDTPVVRMPAKRKWHEYAAAAAVVFIISFGAYWTLGTNRQTSSEANNTQIALHEISNEEIFGYLTQETEGVELIELASLLSEENIDRPFDINERVEDQEIEEYLNYML
ncbi:MAG TPA: hypothetical protein PKA53_10460, partial [Sphingobacterium sp.]|nr:hypothetical protein [Sphingobacterium sp.]